MNRYVVDASVVAAAFFREDSADRAARLLAETLELLAPDLIHAEIANVIWKRFSRNEIDGLEAEQLLADIQSVPIQATPCAELAQMALNLAIETGRTAYDCLYLALAISSNCQFVTADKRFCNAMKNGKQAASGVWIGDWP